MEIKSILIVNREEIVPRALRTIKEMGKKAICVYSEADKDALYLKYVDASICAGKVRSSRSYPSIPAVTSAIEIARADAIFPGYGFLSENQIFVEICAKHNIKFIGPPVEAMNLMSGRPKTKRVIQRAGVPVIPGSDGTLAGAKMAKKLAKETGYPVTLEATAGGGGHGMHAVEHEEGLEETYRSAESKAMTVFGDRTMYTEKYIQNPRHIEAQIIGDNFGNVVHIGEGDCSTQRYHQKFIKESPAVLLDEKTRTRPHETAMKAAKAISYEGTGTFEFLIDENLDFCFIGMNTRLQAEHRVSEMASGTDIIEQTTKVAKGYVLPSQENVKLKGHSIECRIITEDPKTFLPSPGKVVKYVPPAGRSVRIESYCYQDCSTSPYYDSMIGKLAVWVEDRNRAISKVKVALDELIIGGIKATKDFHLAMMDNPDFIGNSYDINYLARH